MREFNNVFSLLLKELIMDEERLKEIYEMRIDVLASHLQFTHSSDAMHVNTLADYDNSKTTYEYCAQEAKTMFGSLDDFIKGKVSEFELCDFNKIVLRTINILTTRKMEDAKSYNDFHAKRVLISPKDEDVINCLYMGGYDKDVIKKELANIRKL